MSQEKISFKTWFEAIDPFGQTSIHHDDSAEFDFDKTVIHKDEINPENLDLTPRAKRELEAALKDSEHRMVSFRAYDDARSPIYILDRKEMTEEEARKYYLNKNEIEFTPDGSRYKVVGKEKWFSTSIPVWATVSMKQFKPAPYAQEFQRQAKSFEPEVNPQSPKIKLDF